MRVITGLAKGFNLKTLDSPKTRPATDRVKENIFNLLIGEDLSGPGADIFAGSGALGIEMLSRGATNCLFVEANPEAASIIRENLTHVAKNIPAIGDVSRMVKTVSWEEFVATANPQSLQWIFLDPPFPLSNDPAYGPRIVEMVLPLLRSDGILIYRQHKKVKDQQWEQEPIKDKTYGVNRVMFFSSAGL